MKLVINECEENEELEIIINCKKADDNILKIVSMIKFNDIKLTVTRDGNLFILDIDNIFYFESVDKKNFVYTQDEVYETSLRLYEIEEIYPDTDFFRASKSTVINVSKIKMIKPLFGGKVEVLLENEEKLVVSRQYVSVLKKKINY